MKKVKNIFHKIANADLIKKAIAPRAQSLFSVYRFTW